jgi:membrane protein YdbS with pleckstrin-like domain
MSGTHEWLSLTDGEEVVWEGQPRLWRIAPAVGKSVAWALAFVVVAIAGPRFAPPSIPGVAVTGVALLLAVASLGSGAMAYLRTRNVEYVLTNRNVYRKSGVWSTNVTRVAVANVQNVRMTKDFWGDRFDYGTVAVSTAGSEGTDVAFSDLPSPETAREQLQRLMNQARGRDREADARTGVLDAGTVTQMREEFQGLREAAERLEAEVTAR